MTPFFSLPSRGAVVTVDPERVPIQTDLKGISASDSTKGDA
jgi:hypothetical protein